MSDITNASWVYYALMAAMMIAIISLLFRLLHLKQQAPAATIFLFKAVAGVCLALELLGSAEIPRLSSEHWIYLLLLGLLSNIGDIGQLRSIALAPNPGYAQGVIFVYPLLVMLGAIFLPGFSEELNPLKALGVLLSVVGTVILVMPEKRK